MHNYNDLVSFLCSARLIVVLEFRPDGCFAEQWTVRYPPKSTMKTAILPKNTRTQRNATCRLRSARAPGSLDLGVRYLTLFFCLLFEKKSGQMFWRFSREPNLGSDSRERYKRGLLMYLYLNFRENSAQRHVELEAGRDQFCVWLTMSRLRLINADQTRFHRLRRNATH